MFDKLEDLLRRFEEIQNELSEPTVVSDQNRFRKLMKEQNDLAPIVEAYTEYKKEKQNIEDSLMILEEESDEDKADLRFQNGEIQFENVYFSYEKEKPLIQGLCVKAEQGKRVAIVGRTGSGKTTLINLLMRFYEVDDGTICVDGTNTRTVTRSSLRKRFGMVLQETWLKSGTVRENLMIGKPNCTEEEMLIATKASHAHGFIKRMEKGYDTVLAEDGGNLSEGQKQLLCIARVMLALPPMLILDEATSSIDTRTERKIGEAFDRLMQGRTTFIVAHRLSTIRNADCILVMQNGSVVEQGTHEELLQKNGAYATLYNGQFA